MLRAITYWQAMGILVLSKILFGFGGRGGRGGAPWMRHNMERFKNMSPEEQERFREEMRARCGKWGSITAIALTGANQKATTEEAPKATRIKLSVILSNFGLAD